MPLPPIEFEIGAKVYLRAADQKRGGYVTGLFIRPTGVLYAVGWGNREETDHYGFELTREYVPDFVNDDDEEED